MNGSVRQRGSTWSYRIDLGTINGKRKQKEKGGFKSQKEAKQAMQLAIAEIIQKGELKESKKITLNEVFEEFILYEAPITRKHATIVRYQSLYNNHVNVFGDIIMSNIAANDLQKFITSKLIDDGLSNDYVKSIYNFLLVLWKYGLKNKYVLENVVEVIKPPKAYRSTSEIKIYTMDEIKQIWHRIEHTNNAHAFMLALKLGLRIGEIYALRWQDIDFENNVVHINKQLQKQNKKWCFTTLKTPNSYRKIYFDGELKKYLINLKNKQDFDKEFFGNLYKSNKILDKTSKIEELLTVYDFVNCKDDGQMLTTDSCKFISAVSKSDLNIHFKMHNLRHTHATLLLEKGLNPKYISERLGHSKLEFTLKLYTHITRGMDEQAVEILNFSLD